MQPPIGIQRRISRVRNPPVRYGGKAETIFAQGLAGVEKPADVRKFVDGQLYKPEYPRHL
jgi:hypothetical protein